MVNYVSDEDIVITGISARLPNSSNIAEFEEQLYAGVDLISDENGRWPKGMYDLTDRVGKIKEKDLKSFDMNAFDINKNQADNMDPMNRLLLEVTHEAIVDSGYNPEELRGSRTAVYVGATPSLGEIERYFCRDVDKIHGDARMGCCFFMFANRVSFVFDFKGPSYAIDCACASSLYSLINAYQDIKAGYIDSAIVSGVLYVHSPISVLQLTRLGILSKDGYCRPFDQDSDGYVPSDACTVLFLQRRREARRVYTQVLGAKHSNDGYKPEGITFPSGKQHINLYRDIYSEINVSPRDVVYMEAHGTATKAGDAQEIGGVSEFFRIDGDPPLLLGSLKSNMGHSEAAAGVSSIVKVILSMQNGIIPANLHMKELKADLQASSDRIKIVTENTRWSGGIVGLNSFGFGGDNGHTVLKSHEKLKSNHVTIRTDLPRLVLVSGRTKNAVDRFISFVDKHQGDEEYLALINEIHKIDMPKHSFRGFYLTSGGNVMNKDVQEIASKNRPIWFVYNGLGSQWPSMSKSMMKMPLFKEAIDRCAAVLRPHGLNLIDILSTGDESVLNEPKNVFVAVTSIQLALTDILIKLGIRPSGYLGHSFGELACAYVDECLTLKQTVLAAYYRGKCISDNSKNLINGRMAAVGLTWDACVKELPADIQIACHNSKDNITISGPTNSVLKYTENLKARNIFARIVNSLGLAAHSKYVEPASKSLVAEYKRIVKSPKERSCRWISTSVLDTDIDSASSTTCSVDYLANNFNRPVYFYEALQKVPDDAICIEIGPHGLLQAILRRSLKKTVTNVSLMRNGHENNLQFFMENVGRIYNHGGQPQISLLYPKVEFPVSCGTPMINSAVEWDHSMEFEVPKLPAQCTETQIEVNLDWDQYTHLLNTRVGEVWFGAANYIVIVWKALANIHYKQMDKMSIDLKNLKIIRPTLIPPKTTVTFNVSLMAISGQFELSENGESVATGIISIAPNVVDELNSVEIEEKSSDNCILRSRDIGTEVRLRGWNFNDYREIEEADVTFTNGRLRWTKNWDVFLEAMLFFQLFGEPVYRRRAKTIEIDSIRIDTQRHGEIVGMKPNVHIRCSQFPKTVKCGGVHMSGIYMEANENTDDPKYKPLLERYEFVPYEYQWASAENTEDAIRVSLQTVFENGIVAKKQILDFNLGGSEMGISDTIKRLLSTEPNKVYDFEVVTDAKAIVPMDNDLVVGYASQTTDVMELVGTLFNYTRKDGFVFLINVRSTDWHSVLSKKGIQIVSNQNCGEKPFILLRRTVDFKSRPKTIITATNRSFNWINDLKKEVKKSEKTGQHIYIVCQKEKEFGGVGLLNCLRQEISGSFIRLVHVPDEKADRFSFDQSQYIEQLTKDLTINVLQNGQWGSYRHLQLTSKQSTSIERLRNAYAVPVEPGNATSFQWVERLFNEENISPFNEKCTIYCAGINQSDSVRLQSLNGIGIEFSGLNSVGKRVMGLLSSTTALATNCVARKSLLWNVPDSWSLEGAATVPYAYAIAYYSLCVYNRIPSNQTILILDGWSNVGQAAISVALEKNLATYATVRNIEEKQLLQMRFPSLSNGRIWINLHAELSSNNSAKETIFDNIFNTNQGDLTEYLKYLNRECRVISYGRSNASNKVLLLQKDISIINVNLDCLLQTCLSSLNELRALISTGIDKKIVQPFQLAVFSINQLEDAFVLLRNPATQKKIVIKIRSENETNIERTQLNTTCRTYFSDSKSYVITGGLGGLGLELAYWMITRGARHIMLVSRSGIKTSYQMYMLQKFHEWEANVEVYTADISDSGETKNMLRKAINMGSALDGIFHLAGILRDGAFDNLNTKEFEAAAAAKYHGTGNLDALTRDLVPQMKYFVCFSSVVSGRGGIGQTNYGLSSSAMERICEQRKLCGFNAIAIQWGVNADTGMIKDTFGTFSGNVAGTAPQHISSVLRSLDYLINQPFTILACCVVFKKNMFETSSENIDLAERIIKSLLNKDVKDIRGTDTLENLGLDSILVVQAKQMIERICNVSIEMNAIRKMTLADLKELEKN